MFSRAKLSGSHTRQFWGCFDPTLRRDGKIWIFFEFQFCSFCFFFLMLRSNEMRKDDNEKCSTFQHWWGGRADREKCRFRKKAAIPFLLFHRKNRNIGALISASNYVIQVRFFMKNASPTLVFGQKLHENVQHERALLISNWKTSVFPWLSKKKSSISARLANFELKS